MSTVRVTRIHLDARRMCESKELVITPTINTTSTGITINTCEWTHWGMTPGPSACEADVIPIHDEPSWNKPCSVNSSHHDDDNEHSSCQLSAHTAQKYGAWATRRSSFKEPAFPTSVSREQEDGNSNKGERTTFSLQ